MTAFQSSLPQLLTTDELADRPATSIRHVRPLVADHRLRRLKAGLVCLGTGEITARLDQHGRPTDEARSRRLH